MYAIEFEIISNIAEQRFRIYNFTILIRIIPMKYILGAMTFI